MFQKVASLVVLNSIVDYLNLSSMNKNLKDCEIIIEQFLYIEIWRTIVHIFQASVLHNLGPKFPI